MKKFRYIIAILPIIILVVLLASPKTKSRLANNAMMSDGGGRGTVSNVQGGTATVTQFEQPSFKVTASSQNWHTLGVTYRDKETGEIKKYGGSKITVTFANNEYTAYCLDPQLALPQGELICNPINYNPQINAFMNDIGSTSGSEEEVQQNQLMFRIWAAIEGWTIGEENYDDSSYDEDEEVYDEEGNLVEDGSLGGTFGKEQKGFKETVKLYHQIYKSNSLYKNYLDVCGEKLCETKEEVLSNLIGDTDGNFKKAFDKAVEVIDNNEQYQESGTENIQGQIRTKIISQTDTEVVFELQSLVEMDGKLESVTIPTLTVQCIEGCAKSGYVPGHEWDGTKGRYKITLIENVCEYKINLYYDTKGAYECSTNDPNTQTLYTYIDKTSTEAVQQIKGIAPGCGNTCCDEAPMIDPEYLDVDVNNCCAPTTSKVEEYKLNDLFCYDEQLKVDHYDAKCNAEAFMEEINLFCEMYCTEKVTVDLPGAITAVSGRYFTLTKNPIGNTTSPYITGTKRCRIITDMGTWFNEYTAQVKQQVEYFNLYQEFSAIDKMLDKIISTEQKQTRNVEIVCEPEKETVTLCGKQVDVTCSDRQTTQGVPVQLLNYAYQPDENQKEKYFVAEISEGLVDSNIKDSEYENLEIKIKGERRVSDIKQYTAQQVVSLSYVYDKRYTDSKALAEWQNAADQKVQNFQNGLSGCPVSSPESTCTSTTTVKYKCERKKIPEEESGYLSKISSTNTELNGGQIDFRGFSQNVKDSLVSLANLYNAAASTAEGYEKDLDTCHNYFTQNTAEKLYEFSPTQTFHYTQSYLNDNGKLVSDDIYVDFANNPGCKPVVVASDENTSDEDISKSVISEVYKDKDFTSIDLIKMDEMKWIKSKEEFEQFKSDKYEGTKYVRNDGKVTYKCEWEEKPNTRYTLVQTGAVVTEKTSMMQATIHERQYQVYLTTLEGTYETFWDIKGLGTKGKFDDDFKNAGRTCANEDPNEETMFTCKLQVEHEAVFTGYCNGVVNGTQNCDPFKEGYELVNFKVVEPSDLFPSVDDPEEIPSHQGDIYGYNWVVDPEGQEVLGKIQEKGQEDLTYAPENLSYAFKITPSDMRQIKDYNTQQVDKGRGGYTDFNLTCTCPTEVNPTTPCTKCKSKFVENLANGKIEFDTGSAEVTGWNNPEETLGSVRDENHW